MQTLQSISKNLIKGGFTVRISPSPFVVHLLTCLQISTKLPCVIGKSRYLIGYRDHEGAGLR